ncbi:MAG TPA: hypothetical protein VGE27_00065 [Gemmatimonas sp.]|uniref:hypothetical protein n=1 Tax=Gemmatimonas sp. TaxID=1962908 RepID=UPI002EDBB1C9
MNWLPLVLLASLLLVFVGGVAIAVKIARRRDAQRLAALSQVAADLGLSFTPTDNGVLRDLGGFAFYQSRSLPLATSVMRGRIHDTDILLFDYDTTLGSSNNRQLIRFTVAAFDVRATPLPVFTTQGTPQNRFARFVDKHLANASIVFPEDAAFSGAVHVASADVDGVKRVLDADVRAFLIRRKPWMCRSTGNWLVLAWFQERPTPADYPDFVREACEGKRLMCEWRKPDHHG